MREPLLFALIFLIAFGVSTIAATRTLHTKKVFKAKAPVVLPIVPETLLGARTNYLGDPNSPYTLVEFMDYQCPPCKRVHAKIPNMLTQYDGKLRLTIRNFPLKMHKQALPAAIAAEAAREQGCFWVMHNALLEQDKLDSENIVAIARENGLNRSLFKRSSASTAKMTVEADVRQAAELRLEGTPAFLLCCPDGQVLRIHSLSQLKDLIH